MLFVPDHDCPRRADEAGPEDDKDSTTRILGKFV